MRKPAHRTAATLLTLTLALGFIPLAVSSAQAAPIDNSAVEIEVVIPAAKAIATKDGQLRWGINAESSSGAHFGGCNFLSAGVAGDSGSSRVWTQADGFYRAKAGDTTIVKPTAKGTWVPDSWAGRCQDASGRTVGTDTTERGTGAQILMEAGVGSIDAAQGKATISWKGAFTVASYGGLSYWSVSDPVFTVANGRGKLQATASGYAADRLDSTVWNKVAPRTVTLATASKVALGAKGIVFTPDYTGVRVERVDPAQERAKSGWGAFPQNFVDFHAHTGQAAYWYSSGAIRDAAKVPTEVRISFSANDPVAPQKPLPEVVAPPTSPVSKPDPETNSGQESPAAAPTTAPVTTQEPIPGTIMPGSPLGGEVLADGSISTSDPIPGIIRTAGTGTAQAMEWLGGTLVPQAVELAKDHRDTLLWSTSVLLLLGSFGWVGFRRGWLILPWKR